VDIGEQIKCAEAFAAHFVERADFWGDDSAAMRAYQKEEHDNAETFREIAKSLRLVPKLIELKARAKEMLVVIDAQREGRGMDVVYDAGTTTAAFRAALAALDAGEGG